MATSCVPVVRTLLTGWHLVPGRLLLPQHSQSLALCQRLRFHASPSASQSSAGTEPRRAGQTQIPPREPPAGGADEEEPEGPEYIPRRKAKNPMKSIGYAWMIGLPAGVIGFILAKRQVDKNRLKQLKVRQRMKHSNEGVYERSRYRQHADLKLDK